MSTKKLSSTKKSAKNGYLRSSKKGDPLGRQLVESLREEASAPPPPLNLLVHILPNKGKEE